MSPQILLIKTPVRGLLVSTMVAEQADQGPAQIVGARVLILDHKATVRYIGSVNGQQGTWVGVEYDDPTRGKHDGVANGTRYFTATRGQTAASFVRAEKVNWGCSLLDALVARYHNQRSEEGLDVDLKELYVRTTSARRVQIQVVGVDKIQQLQSQTHQLTSARLAGAGISFVGDAQGLQRAAANLIELDLTGNLITDWEAFVPRLCAALPSLQAINLSENIMFRLPHPTLPGATLPQLKALVLNDCNITWQQVLDLQSQLPNLQELHIAGNTITRLSASPPDTETAHSSHQPAFQRLEVLSLDDNQVSDWKEVLQQLGTLPALRILNLSQNALSSVTMPQPSGQQPGAFKSLETLYLASCKLNSWSDIDALNLMPQLRDCRLTGNPVLNLSKGGGRFEVIGRVAGLTMLNGAAVNSRERRDAEIRYLQNIISGHATGAQCEAKHPRFRQLQSLYGEVLGTSSQQGQGSSLAASMLQLKLTCVAAAHGAKMGTHEKKLPRSTQLAALRLLCEKLFKVRVADQVLYMKTANDPLPQELSQEEDVSSLDALGLQDGGEILVDHRES